MATAMNKTARVNCIFWIMKICATTIGETAGDLLTKTGDQGGLGFGTIGSSAILACLLAGLVIHTHRREKGCRSV